jgi:hypothetical protein
VIDAGLVTVILRGSMIARFDSSFSMSWGGL